MELQKLFISLHHQIKTDMKTSHRTMHQSITAKAKDIKLFGYVTKERLILNAIKFKSEKSKGL